MSAFANIGIGPIPVRVVLLVGGDLHIAEQLRDILEPGLWAVHKASNNSVALAMALVTNFDLILTSEKTSGREDVELLRKLRTARSHTRLIILTEESTPTDVITSMREHAFIYFSKPFGREALAVMIRRAIEEPCWDDGIDVVSATPEWIRIFARCDLKTADRVLQFFDEIAELPNPERIAVGMAFREMLTNAIEHGGRLDLTSKLKSLMYGLAILSRAGLVIRAKALCWAIFRTQQSQILMTIRYGISTTERRMACVRVGLAFC
jgi:PleD family two-component response regulator